MIRPVLITPPETTPVSLADLKQEAAAGFTDDDALLQGYLGAAIAHLDGYAGILGRCLISQTWAQPFRCWRDRMRLPFPDVASVVVTYFDDEAAEQTVSDDLYEVTEGPRGAEVVFKDAFIRPSLDDDRDAPVKMTFVAGYGAAEDVPQDIKICILALARHWYDRNPGDPPQMRMIEKHRFRLV